MGFTFPSFVDYSLISSFDDDFSMMDSESMTEPISPKGSFTDNLGLVSEQFEMNPPEPGFALDPAQLHKYSGSNNLHTGSLPSSIFLDTITTPLDARLNNGVLVNDAPKSTDSSYQNPDSPLLCQTSSSVSSPSLSNSVIDRFQEHDQSMLMRKRASAEAPFSYDNDSDSNVSTCQCIEHALQLLEKLPNPASESSAFPGDNSDMPLETADSHFDANEEPPAHSCIDTIETSGFVTSSAQFLSNFSRHMTVFSTVSSCQSCLCKSSFAMILLMLAQRLTSRVKLLLLHHAPSRDEEIVSIPSSSRYTLTIGDHVVEYEDPLRLISTLLVGKIHRLASCVGKLKATCVSARWNAYARGFETLEAPLKERIVELETMM